MEKNNDKLKLILIVIDGPDCTGKESLSEMIRTYINGMYKRSKLPNATSDDEIYKDVVVDFDKRYKPVVIKPSEYIRNLPRNKSLNYVMKYVDDLIIDKIEFPDYGSDIGKKIKALLMSDDIDLNELETLFAEDIVTSMKRFIDTVEERSAKGIWTIVLCDRYLTSNYAYMMSKGRTTEAINMFTKYSKRIPVPDIMIDTGINMKKFDVYLNRLADRGDMDAHEKDTKLLSRVNDIYSSGKIANAVFGSDTLLKMTDNHNHVIDRYHLIDWWEDKCLTETMLRILKSINDRIN